MALFAEKILRAEVTDGVDLETGIYLTGDRVTVGSSVEDTLHLGGARVVPAHVTFVRSADGKGWEYFTSGRGEVEIDRGNTRTGRVRPGMWLRLGPETRLTISHMPAPPNLKGTAAGGAKTEIPLAYAVPIMAIMAAGLIWYLSSLASSGAPLAESLRTEAWYRGAAIEPALDICLDAATVDGAVVPVSAPDAAFRAYAAASDPEQAERIKADLARQLRSILIEAHLLIGEDRYAESWTTLERVERALPVTASACPILSYARADLATLAIRAGRR